MTADSQPRACAFPQCGREVQALGLCVAHYRQQAAGKTLTPIRAHRKRATAQQIVELWDQGLSQAAIREHTGAMEKRIKKVVQDAGRVWEPRRATPERADHGLPGRWAAGCRCDVCVAGNRDYRAAEYQRRKEQAAKALDHLPHPSPKTVVAGCQCEKCYRVGAEKLAARQDRTRAQAMSHGKEWTAEDVYTAVRGDLRIEDAAKVLGRTYAAVSNVRAALLDPDKPGHERYVWLLQQAIEKP